MNESLSQFYFVEIEKEARKVIREKKLTEQQIDEFAAQHNRVSTP